MTHDELANDLARHLRGMQDVLVWTNMQLGPSGSPRPDVYTIHKSYVRPRPMAYEVKVSVADFRSDVTSAKWSTYQAYAHGVVFACPAGLLSKSDVPEQCGLMVRGESWRWVKKPTLNPRPIDQGALLKLLFDGVEREGPTVIRERYHASAGAEQYEKKFGAIAGRCARDLMWAESELTAAHKKASEIISDARKRAERESAEIAKETPLLWAQLLTALGLPPSTTQPWIVTDAINKLRRNLAPTAGFARELERITLQLSQLSDAVRMELQAQIPEATEVSPCGSDSCNGLTK